MKRKIPMLMLAMAMLFSAVALAVVPTGTASAASDGAWNYERIGTTNNATITGYTGSDTAISIPATVGGYTVTGISESAFYQNTTLESVTIGNSVTSIGNNAFWECIALTSVVVGNNVTSIGDQAFAYCNALTTMVFEGDAPSVGSAWAWPAPLTVYYYDGATGFGATLGDMPTAMLEVTITSPQDGSNINTGSVTVGWTIAAPGFVHGINVSIDGETWEQAQEETSHTFASLDDGEYDVTVRVTYKGNNSVTDTVFFAVDTEAPTVTITSPSETLLNSRLVTVAWTADDNNDTELDVVVEFSTDDGATWTPISGPDYIFSAPGDGQIIVRVNATDDAGNWNVTQVTFLVDSSPPQVIITAPTITRLNERSFTITWTATDTVDEELEFEISINGGDFEPVTGMSYLFSTAVDDDFTVIVRATDDARNYDEATVQFTVDTSNPSIVSNSPEGTDVPIGSTITVEFSEGMNTSSVNITLNGGEAITASSWDGNIATFVLGSPLAYDIEYIVVVSGKDLAGNALSGTTNWTFSTEIGGGSISGTVVDENGQPVGGATVRLNSTVSVTTNETGHFVLSAIVPGTYTLSVTKSGYVSVSKVVVVAAGVENATGALKMEKDEGSIAGQIKDRDGNPLAGVTVRLNATVSTTTDETGHFVITEVPAGTHILTVSKSGFVGVSLTVTVTAEGTNNTGILTLVKDEGSITGTIVVREGNALAGVTVSLSNGMTATTDASGGFTFDGVPSGSRTLTVSKDGYVTLARGVSVTVGGTAALGELTLVKNEGSVAGVIMDGSGDPVAGAAVSLSNGRTATTNATGHFEFTGLASGPYTLTVSKDGCQNITKSITVIVGATANAGTMNLVSSETTDKEDDPDNTLLYVGVIATIVIVGTIGAFFFLKRQKK